MKQIKFKIWDTKYKKFWGVIDLSAPRHSWCVPLGDNDNYILLQFTGFKDKNGMEIYEGDVLRFNGNDPFFGEIRFVDGCFQVKAIRYKTIMHPIKDYNKTYEITGNIYENPELLNPHE